MQIKSVESGKYVVAVSGGVDSMVLVDILGKHSELELEIAHLNHGIREDSDRDEEFVGEYAKKMNLPYHSKKVSLGQGASEEEARKARYKFFDEVMSGEDFDGLITAHHRDDVIETAMINLLRGTGWRGMVAMQNNEKVIRPLIDVTKDEILAYAKEHKIKWNEDSTNAENIYLRNKLRNEIISSDLPQKEQLKKLVEDHEEIEGELRALIKDFCESVILENNPLTISRYEFIMLPHDIAGEVTRELINELSPKPEANKELIGRMIRFIKTSLPNKTLELGSGWEMQSTKREVVLNKN